MSIENPNGLPLVDYNEAEDVNITTNVLPENENSDAVKGHYVGMNTRGFKDFYLKDEIMTAISACGFEHPSEVQLECIPRAITHKDILCQAKSGMGKTAVFVISTLHMLEDVETNNGVQVIVFAHTRELADQIQSEYNRFTVAMPNVKTAVVIGGRNIQQDIDALKSSPAIVVGTPGRLSDLVSRKVLNLDKLKYFVVDECDHIMDSPKVRMQMQNVFIASPKEKQVMMFTATLPNHVKEICRKYMRDPLVVELDEKELTLHGLTQYYHTVDEFDKPKKLLDLLEHLDFNQIVIFARSTSRAKKLSQLLTEQAFPNVCIYGDMNTEERLQRMRQFKAREYVILVSTQLLGRGVDVEHVNVVINYDFPTKVDEYMHRVGRAGRFGTKGLAISFVSDSEEVKMMEEVQMRFAIDIPKLPESIDSSLYQLNSKKDE